MPNEEEEVVVPVEHRPCIRCCLIGSLLRPTSTIRQFQHQHQQTGICPHTQRRQHYDHIPRRPKFLPAHHTDRTSVISSHSLRLSEELPIPLLSPIRTHSQHPGAVYGEERADAVEFAGEDLEHDEREGELRQRRADVGAFEGALCGPDLDELVVGEVDGASAVEAQPVFILRVAALEDMSERMCG
jgi:hypothetical protein